MEPSPSKTTASLEVSRNPAPTSEDSTLPTKRKGLYNPRWRIAWEHIVPAIVAVGVLLASLATSWTKSETVLWAIVSFLLTQTLIFQVIASQDRDLLQDALSKVLRDRQEKMDHLVELTSQQPQTIRREVIETLRSSVPAMDVRDTYLQIHRDHTALATIADAVLQRAQDDLNQIFSKRQYTMRVTTPSEDYVQRWYGLMEKLNLKEYQDAEFLTMSNIVIWSSQYFGKTAYGNLQRRSSMNIRRIFVVPSNAQLKEDPQLSIHLYSVLRDYAAKIHPVDDEVPKIQTKIHVAADAKEYRDHFVKEHGRSSNNFAIWRISNETKLLLTVDYVQGREETDFEVAGITFGQSSLGPSSLEIADKEESFQRRWEEKAPAVLPIQDYLKVLGEMIK